MLSNGNLSYLQQGAPQFGLGLFGPAGGYGGNPGWGPESTYQQGFAQQPIPFGNSFAAHAGPQIIWALGQLAQQVATQGIVAQQLGAALSQLTQHVATQILQGAGNVYGGNPAFNPLLQNFGAPGHGGQSGNFFGGFAGNPAFTGGGAGAQGPGQNSFAGALHAQGYGGFAPQNPGWGGNRAAMN